MSAYRITPSAGRDLQAIYEYLADEDLATAGRMIHRLRDGFHAIAEVPGRGHLRDDLTGLKLLFWRVGPYLVAYRVQDTIVEIVRVIHGARDIPALLAHEED